MFPQGPALIIITINSPSATLRAPHTGGRKPRALRAAPSGWPPRRQELPALHRDPSSRPPALHLPTALPSWGQSPVLGSLNNRAIHTLPPFPADHHLGVAHLSRCRRASQETGRGGRQLSPASNRHANSGLRFPTEDVEKRRREGQSGTRGSGLPFLHHRAPRPHATAWLCANTTARLAAHPLPQTGGHHIPTRTGGWVKELLEATASPTTTRPAPPAPPLGVSKPQLPQARIGEGTTGRSFSTGGQDAVLVSLLEP